MGPVRWAEPVRLVTRVQTSRPARARANRAMHPPIDEHAMRRVARIALPSLILRVALLGAAAAGPAAAATHRSAPSVDVAPIILGTAGCFTCATTTYYVDSIYNT